MPDKFPQQNVEYFRDRHLAVLAQGRQLYDDKGRVTTLRTATVGGENGEPAYIIPLYDPISRKILPADEAFRRVLPDIQSGRLVSYPTWQDAEAHLQQFYPEVISSMPKLRTNEVTR